MSWLDIISSKNALIFDLNLYKSLNQILIVFENNKDKTN